MSRFSPKPVSNEECQKIVKKKLEWILKLCSPSRVWVFGSAARCDMTDHSDVDLALIFDDKSKLKAARDKVFVRAPDDEWPQDILLYIESDFERKKKVGGVCQIIAEDGVCLYERKDL